MSHKPESGLRNNIKRIIEKAGWLCLPYPGGIYGTRGVPDYICCVPPGGHFVAVEVKMPGEKPKPHQLAMHRLMASKCARVVVLDSVLKAQKLVEKGIDF